MTTVGTYLAQRLEELGIGSYFAIRRDYNMFAKGLLNLH